MPRDRAQAEVCRMVESINHDATNGTGVWTDESLGVYVGWAIRKNSFSHGMPLRNPAGDVTLVLSGEEYPEPGVTRRPGAPGSGPAYLLDRYRDEPDFPAGLNGRFQGLVADRTRGIAKLFVDRYGMNRIYYHEAKDAFYFASEAKAILAVRSELRKVDARGLGELVACGCILENRTLFQGICLMPPASSWVFRNGALDQQGVYFRPEEWENQGSLEAEAYYRELREVFSTILPRYFNGREPIGMSLTGGLDTRMIMAWQKSAPNELPCYSFGGTFRDCEDVVVARKVARECGQPYQVIPVGAEFLSNFSKYAERTVYLTDGCANVSASPSLYANEKAAHIAPVRMTGNYGGEILRRLRAFKAVDPIPGLYRPELMSEVRRAHDTYRGLLGGHAVSFVAFRQTPWYHYNMFSLEQTQLTLRSPFLDNHLVRTAFRAPGSAIETSDIFEDNTDCVRLISDGNPALGRIRTDRGLAGPTGVSGTISRSVLEFSFKAEYAYDYGMPQWVAKLDHLVSWLHLERLFLGRHKFSHFRVWYRDSLAQYIREMLLDQRTLSRPYLERSRVEAVVSGHLRGTHNYTTQIHQLLTLELVHRLFLDSR